LPYNKKVRPSVMGPLLPKRDRAVPTSGNIANESLYSGLNTAEKLRWKQTE